LFGGSRHRNAQFAAELLIWLGSFRGRSSWGYERARSQMSRPEPTGRDILLYQKRCAIFRLMRERRGRHSHRLLLIAAPFAFISHPNFTNRDFDAVGRAAFAAFYIALARDLRDGG